MRALPDPHYGLPVVVCPGCGRAVVRTKHPDRVFWRQVRRTLVSIRALLFALVFSVLSIGALAASAKWMTQWVTDQHGKLVLPTDTEPSERNAIIMLASLTILCGVVIRAVYAHQRLWAAALVLFVPAAVLLSIDWSVGWLLVYANRLIPTGYTPAVPDRFEIFRRYESFFVVACIAVVGMGVGGVLNRFIAKSTTKRIVRRRRKLRKRQARQD